jgi:hypothetical protein
LSSSLTEHRRRRFYTAVARPPRCSSTSGEALDRTPASSSFFLSSRGELSWTRAPVSRAPVSSSSRRRRPVHGGSEPRWSTAREPSSRDYQFKNKSEIPLFWTFFIWAPWFLRNQPAVHDFTVRSENLKNNSKKVPSLRKIHKIAPKIHIFSTTTLKPVILVPKFSESLPLSFYAFI